MTFSFNADASGTSIATRQGFQDRVFLLLPQQDQETIRQHTVPNVIDVDMIIQQALTATRQKQGDMPGKEMDLYIPHIAD
jgi:hypothetical protein